MVNVSAVKKISTVRLYVFLLGKMYNTKNYFKNVDNYLVHFHPYTENVAF